MSELEIFLLIGLIVFFCSNLFFVACWLDAKEKIGHLRFVLTLYEDRERIRNRP